MIQLLHGRHLRRLPWFVAGLLCSLFFSFALPSIWQPVIAASNANAVNYAATSKSTSFVAPSFKRVAASHLEPNFYK